VNNSERRNFENLFKDPPKDIPHENIQDCPFFGGSISPQKQNIFSSNDTDKRELFEKGIHQQNIFNNDINFDSEKKQFALNPIDNN
jgi:hypothetical protein